MGRYVARRLLQMIPVFIGSTFLIFFMVYALGDPVAALFGDAIVPLESATFRFAPDAKRELDAHCDVKHLPGISHLGLAHDARVYEAIRSWCEEER